jgi:SAM-dependent methyltransferase
MRLRALIPGPVRKGCWRLARRLLAGSTVLCPVCNDSLRFFLPFGVGGRVRRNALCPGCRSLERDRLAWLQLMKEQSLLVPPIRLLHVAPEACFAPRLRATLGAAYITADLSRADVDVQLSIEQLPFPDGSFDAIICNHVLEHVADDRKAMREIHRALRPGGWALLQVPLAEELACTLEDDSVVTPSERKRRFGQHDHVRAYGRDYRDRLREAGFRVECLRVADLYRRTEIERYGLDPSETLHLCRRS